MIRGLLANFSPGGAWRSIVRTSACALSKARALGEARREGVDPADPPSLPVAGRWAWAETVMLLAGGLLAAGHVAWTHQRAVARPEPVPGVRLQGEVVGGLDSSSLLDRVDAAISTALERTITLHAGATSVDVTARALGAKADREATVAALRSIGRSGDVLDDLVARARAARDDLDLPVGFRFDENDALTQLRRLVERADTPSLATRFDFEARRVLPGQTGHRLLVYDSLSSIAVALASGANEVELVMQAKPTVEDPLGQWGEELDIGAQLGRFETSYATGPSDRDRNHNLALGAAKLDGHVVGPGETFSFNGVVGPRSAEAGFRFAGGIAAGELVDVLGGGICQISSTLFGAAFFAGLEVVDARPHSRPSTYVEMGLDSTVVWPDVDLQLRNPYDFPVVFRMVARQGKVVAEVLGPERPHQAAVFERLVDEKIPYETVWRDDDELLLGKEAVAQKGREGYRLRRIRELHIGDEVKREDWDVYYPPTTEIIRRGTDPHGTAPAAAPLVPIRAPEPQLRISQ